MRMAEKQQKFLIERMHFSNPYFFMGYFYLGCAIYLLFSYMGGFAYEILTRDWILYIVLFGVPCVAFAVKKISAGIDLYLEIHQNECRKSPLRALFTSEDAFIRYRDKILNKIFSDEIKLSLSFMLVLALAIIGYDVFFAHCFGKPWNLENAGIWGVLIFVVYYYAWWWVAGIAGFGFAWVVYRLIVAIKRIEQAEDLRIYESIKMLKALTRGEIDENITKKLLRGHYSYTKLLSDYEKIMGFTSFIAITVAFIAIIYSAAYIAIPALFFKEWNLLSVIVGLTIGMEMAAIWVFITPLISAHKLLKRTKKEIYSIVSELYEQHKLRFLNRSASFSPVEPSMVKDMEVLKRIVDETSDLRTWPVEIGDTLRLIAATLISLSPIVLRILQKLIS